MILRFHVDRETGQPHIYEHDITESEVEDVLRQPGEDRPGLAAYRRRRRRK